ncbi:patatin-like phospholipase family protein [Tsukamurella soli]|uniref:Patatin family protein n=1 Tax=Tsukamurella soli TaxID=644556 RepID=A0ABP8KFS9_9ACTN
MSPYPARTAPATVVDVVLARAASGSRPGARDDAYRVALSIEGGGTRSAYSAGMAAAVAEAGLLEAFDAVYGTSGGGLNAAWLLTGEGPKWLPSWGWPDVLAQRVTNPRRLLRGGPLVDTTHLVDHVYSVVTPMDYRAILDNPVSLHPIATDAATGKAVDLARFIRDEAALRRALRATTALPLLAGPPVELGGRLWFDGGLAEPVPFRTPLSQGVTHLLVLRSRKASDPGRPSRVEGIVLDLYFASRRGPYRRAPVAAADEVADTAAVQQIWVPEDGHPVARLSNDGAAIAGAVELGRSTAHAVLAP